MARSLALNNGTARPKNPGAKPPITASPAFRWVVAIWFAALLGVGSLIVPVVLLERASTATGLASILPQAAPPLGFTARALIAGIGTLGGAMLGLVLTRLITRERKPRPAAASWRRPLSASEDLGRLDECEEPGKPAQVANAGGRRRSLAIEEEEGPSDFLIVAPLPGGPSAIEASAADEIEDAPYELNASAELTDAQDAAGHAEDEYITPQPHFERQEFVAVAEANDPVVEAEEVKREPAREMEPLAFSPPSMVRPVVAYNENDAASGRFAARTEALPGFSLNEAPLPEKEEDVSDKQIFEAPQSDLPAPFDAAQADTLDQDAGEDIVDEIGEGLVQLVQRLGATLSKHREWSAEQAVVAAATPAHQVAGRTSAEPAGESAVPEDFDPAAAADAAEAMAEWFGASRSALGSEPVKATPIPGVQYTPYGGSPPVSGDHAEDEDEDVAALAASFTLPLPSKTKAPPDLRPAFDKPPASPEAAEPLANDGDFEDEEADHSANSNSFASLNPFKDKGDEFVRIEEPEPEDGSAEPTVQFPGQESRRAPATAARAFDPPAGQAEAPVRASRPAPSNDDNERALREALLNLQRMSK